MMYCSVLMCTEAVNKKTNIIIIKVIENKILLYTTNDLTS